MKKLARIKKLDKSGGILIAPERHQENRSMLRMMLRSRLGSQDNRKALDNRIGRKADGDLQDLSKLPEGGRMLSIEDGDILKEISDVARRQEMYIEKRLKDVLGRFSHIYGWLQEQKGVGTIASAWLIGEFNIYKANTVSKMYQFSGLNPGMVRGRKSVKKNEYKLEMGTVVRELTSFKGGEKRVEVLTDTMIRGDRKTPGFLCPYNQKLRTALVGVLADGFIKVHAPYTEHYYALHIPDKYRVDRLAMKRRPELAGKYGRRDLSDALVEERRKGKVINIAWKDTSDGHRDRDAKRKMIKEFLKDFYAAWRSFEGLPVRPPYAEEYLGKVHKKAA